MTSTEIEVEDETGTRSLGFTITGEFVTKQARDFCLYEDDWEGGYKLLTENVEGIDHDIAVSMLQGKQRLIGLASPEENTLELVDELPEVKAEIEERMQWLWAGVIKRRPVYWRPYACVTNWGPNDVGAADIYHNRRYAGGSTAVPVNTPGNAVRFQKWGKSRACAYMNDRANDRVEFVKFPKGHKLAGQALTVLFEKVKTPPIWWAPIPSRPECWVESVVAYMDARGLSGRGHNQEFEGPEFTAFDDFRETISEVQHQNNLDSLERNAKDVDKLVGRMPDKFKPEEIDAEVARRLDRQDDDDETDPARSLLERQLLEQMTEFSDVDPEAAAGTIRYIFGPDENSEEVPPIPDDPAEHNYGWITRDGKFYGCMYHHHAELARLIFKFTEGLGDDAPTDAERAADDAGWIKILKSAVGDGEYRMLCCQSPTEQQNSTLEEWAAYHRQDPKDLEIQR